MTFDTFTIHSFQKISHMYVRTATTRQIDISCLAEATAQEVFDTIARHMLTQNERCTLTESVDTPRCLYRLETQGRVLKCAAGCLISDSQYNPNMENVRWSGLTDAKSEFRFSSNHAGLITACQDIHDCKYILASEWPQELLGIAQRYNLIPFSIVH